MQEEVGGWSQKTWILSDKSTHTTYRHVPAVRIIDLDMSLLRMLRKIITCPANERICFILGYAPKVSIFLDLAKQHSQLKPLQTLERWVACFFDLELMWLANRTVIPKSSARSNDLYIYIYRYKPIEYLTFNRCCIDFLGTTPQGAMLSHQVFVERCFFVLSLNVIKTLSKSHKFLVIHFGASCQEVRRSEAVSLSRTGRSGIKTQWNNS